VWREEGGGLLSSSHFSFCGFLSLSHSLLLSVTLERRHAKMNAPQRTPSSSYSHSHIRTRYFSVSLFLCFSLILSLCHFFIFLNFFILSQATAFHGCSTTRARRSLRSNLWRMPKLSMHNGCRCLIQLTRILLFMAHLPTSNEPARCFCSVAA